MEVFTALSRESRSSCESNLVFVSVFVSGHGYPLAIVASQLYRPNEQASEPPAQPLVIAKI